MHRSSLVALPLMVALTCLTGCPEEADTTSSAGCAAASGVASESAGVLWRPNTTDSVRVIARLLTTAARHSPTR